MPKLNKVNGPSLLDKMWDTLDTATADVMGGLLVGEELATRKGYARGVAECIRILSVPVFHSTDAVVSCAVARRGTDAAFSGSPAIVHHAPPDGIISSDELAVHAATQPPVPGTDAAPIDVPPPPVATPGSPPASHVGELSGAQQDGIIAALASGLPAEAVAGAFGVTEGVVQQIGAQT
jgi:hypothetical protein